MHDALETPLAFGALHDAVKRFAHLRTSPTWQIAVDKRRTLPINGVSDAFVEKTTLLNRDDEYLDNELSAALEVGYLLRLASSPSRNEERVIYVSRAGFFLETDTPGNSSDIVQRYYHLVTQPWFTQQSERENRALVYLAAFLLCGQKAADYRQRAGLLPSRLVWRGGDGFHLCHPASPAGGSRGR